MGAKQQALKNAARARAAETGQTYEAALRDVRREYEQGAAAEDSTDERRFGFETAGAEEYRPRTYATGYFVAWGVMELLGEDQVSTLVGHAEASAKPGNEPIQCHLCDQPIDVTREPEVHIGIALHEVKGTELQFPVWTHEKCGTGTRVWSWSQLTLERRRRHLPVAAADLPPKQHRNGPTIEDYFVFTVPEGVPPLFYLQPGQADRHGALGFRADRLSDGLPSVDLARQQLGGLEEWSAVADRTGLQYIQRKGTGRWYQPPTPWTPPADWLAAAHYYETFLFLTAPADSIPTQRLETGTGDLSDLVAVGRRDVLFGGIMSISGLA